MINITNTFGDYEFEEWVPEEVRDLIKEFWGIMGRNHGDWLNNSQCEVKEACSHGPGPNGFGRPKTGDYARYIKYNFEESKRSGKDLYSVYEGRYIHLWNNIGRLVGDDGRITPVSSCDMWVRVYKKLMPELPSQG